MAQTIRLAPGLAMEKGDNGEIKVYQKPIEMPNQVQDIKVTDPNILAQLNNNSDNQDIKVTDPNILAQLNSQSIEQPVLYPDLSNTPTKNGMIENLGRGYLQGGKNAIIGTLQAGADILGSQFPENKTIQEARATLAEGQGRSRTAYQAATGDSTAAEVGQFAGGVAPYALIPAGGANIASRIALGGVGGAIAGGTAPKEQLQSVPDSLEQRQNEALIGAGIGAIVPGGIATLSNKNFLPKLLKINPSAAKDFLEEGVQGSLATLSDRGAIKQFDRAISQYPGGIGVFDEATNKTLENIQTSINKAGASKGVTPQEAGLIIKGGGQKYVDRFNNVSQKLYNRLDDYLPAESKVNVSNSAAQLEKELSGLPENLATRRSKNEGIKILQDITEDGKDGLSYSNLKTYRTDLGNTLAKSYLLPGTDEAILKRAYTALTKDMEAAAASKGELASRAFTRANEFYKAGAQNIDNTLQKVLEKATPEQVYQAAISGTKLGGTKINAIMKSLAPEEREIVSGTVLKQLGSRGQGEFSTRTFLTEWDKLSPEARKAIFGRKEADISRIARITERVNGLGRFANPSGTGQRIGLGGLFVTSLVSKGAAISSILGANASARLMNNQAFTKWLADASMQAVTPRNLTHQLGRLERIAQKDPSIAGDIAKYIGVTTAIATRNKE